MGMKIEENRNTLKIENEANYELTERTAVQCTFRFMSVLQRGRDGSRTSPNLFHSGRNIFAPLGFSFENRVEGSE
jgi:hypothetical protein